MEAHATPAPARVKFPYPVDLPLENQAQLRRKKTIFMVCLTIVLGTIILVIALLSNGTIPTKKISLKGPASELEKRQAEADILADMLAIVRLPFA